MKPVVISAALVGSQPTRAMNPAVPYTPAEIADSAIEAYKAGAAIVHIHVRDPETGVPSSDIALFAEVVARIRDRCPVLINLTTSGFNLETQDPDARLEPLALQPDICSLDVGSVNFAARPFVNSPHWCATAARRTQALGIKPELEVFDAGHVDQATDLVKRGLVDAPPWFQICLGIRWGMPASLQNLLFMHSLLPDGVEWSVLGVGRHQLEMTTVAPFLGGHIRVGFEDNLYWSRGVLAHSNAQLVARAANILHLLNRTPATVAETCAMLKLPRAAGSTSPSRKDTDA